MVVPTTALSAGNCSYSWGAVFPVYVTEMYGPLPASLKEPNCFQCTVSLVDA